MTTSSYHKSNFGAFSGGLPTDLEGYVHLTAQAWLDAPVDTMGMDTDDEDAMQEWAEDMAAQAVAATAEAEAALAAWREENN